MNARGGYLDYVALQHLVYPVLLQQIVERVVERAEIRIHFFLQRTGQKAQAFAGLHRRSHQDDPANLLGQQSRSRHGNRQIGLAGARGSDAKNHVALFDGFQVSASD